MKGAVDSATKSMFVNIAHPGNNEAISAMRRSNAGVFLWVEGVRVRGEVTAEATMGGENKGPCKNPVGELVGAIPEAEDEQLLRVRLGDVHGLEGLVLERDHAALADGLAHANVRARLRESGRAASCCAKHFVETTNCLCCQN